MQIAKGIAVLALLGLAGSAVARPVIDFDTDALGAPIASGTSAVGAQPYAAWGVTFGTDPYAGPNGSGSSASFYATNSGATIASGDVGGFGPANGGSTSGNLLHTFSSDWLSEDGDPVITLTFAPGITAVSLSMVGISSGWTGIELYSGGANGTLVGFDFADVGGQEAFSINGLGDTLVIYVGTFDDWVGIDNISFTNVPTPGAVALLGLGGLVAGRRRRA